MDYALFGMFTLVTLSFIPLFVAIMIKLEKFYNRLYLRVKWKLIIVFSTYITFLCLRLLLFGDIKLFHYWFTAISLYEAIPVYTTEIVVTLTLAYVLFSISKIGGNNRKKDQDERRATNFIAFDVDLHDQGNA